MPGAAIGGAGRCRRVGRTIRSHGNPAKEPLKVARRPRGENDAALESGCVAAPATLGGDKPREAVEGVGAPRSSQHGHGVMPVLRSGGVGAERAADGPLAVGESRAADFSGEWLSAFVIAGAAEPFLSKLLQGRKANVVNAASSQADGSGEHRAAGPPGESEPLRIMGPLCDAGRSAQAGFAAVAVRTENAVPRAGSPGNHARSASARRA